MNQERLHHVGATTLESTLTRPIKGITLREIANAIREAYSQLNPAVNKPLGFAAYYLTDRARTSAMNKAGDKWTIRRQTGPKRGGALEYDREHVTLILHEFEEMAIKAVNSEPWRELPRSLQPLRELRVTPAVVEKAQEMLFPPSLL